MTQTLKAHHIQDMTDRHDKLLQTVQSYIQAACDQLCNDQQTFCQLTADIYEVKVEIE